MKTSMGRPSIARTAVAAVLIICAGWTLSACTDCASVSPGVSPELKHSWELNFNRGDAAAVAALYAPDAQFLMSGSEPAKGIAAIRAAIDLMIKSGVKVHIDTVQNVGAGNIAYVFGSYSVRHSAGPGEIERGTYVEIWRRQDDRWKITIDINAVGPVIAQPAPASLGS